MFDRTSEIEFEARVQSTSNLPQQVTVRYPTDEEWSKRAKARKIIIRRPRAGMSETVLPTPGEAEVALYDAIKLNGAPQMTAIEAEKTLEGLARSDVTGVAVDGTEAVISMNVMTGDVTLKMRLPTADQVFTYRRAALKIYDLSYGQQQITQSPDAGGRLFDECGGTSPDYPQGIPVIHKDQAARALIEFLDRQLGPKQEEPNF